MSEIYLKLNEISQSIELSTWLSIVTGIATGIIASVAIFCVTYAIKPKLIISDVIAHTRISGTEYKYFIKIINKSHYFCMDIKYTLFIYEPTGEGDINSDIVDPSKRKVTFLFGYLKHTKEKLLNNEFALELSFNIGPYISKLKAECEDQLKPYLMLVFEGKHALTNTRKTFIKKYYGKDIFDGEFEDGDSMNIVAQHFDEPNIIVETDQAQLDEVATDTTE